MNKIICGDALTILREMPAESVNTCISSPPYFGLRDYSCAGQVGLEDTPERYTLIEPVFSCESDTPAVEK